MVAGLARGLVRTCCEQALREEPFPMARPELLRVAHWRAARHGLDAELIDVGAMQARPAREVVEGLLQFVRPALEAEGEWDEVAELVHQTLARGNGATRQRAAYRRAGRLEDVVDMLVAETAAGTGLTVA
jgi:carboxylate-amine ligase